MTGHDRKQGGAALIAALAGGATVQEAARQARVSEATVYRTPDPATLELFEVRRELAARFEDPKGRDKRRTLEQRIESAKVLTGRVRQRRREIDGTLDRAHQDMVARYRL